MKLAAFDIETAKELPEDMNGREAIDSLGIACVAVALSDQPEPLVWDGVPQLSQAECRKIVHELQGLHDQGYALLTWNGCKFDFWVLAQESGLHHECGQLALNHIDLMLMVSFIKGHYLGLDKALKGADLAGKMTAVTLRDGTLISDMNGAKAPTMWADGERDAVLSYLRADVAQLLKLGHVVERSRALRWTSQRGYPQTAPIPELLPVKECFGLPQPDVSWMSNPPTRESFVDWIEGWQEQLGIHTKASDSANQQ